MAEAISDEIYSKVLGFNSATTYVGNQLADFSNYEDKQRKQIINYLNSIVYANRNGKQTGFLYETGKLDKMISIHNNSYCYKNPSSNINAKGKNINIFSNVADTDYMCPLRINELKFDTGEAQIAGSIKNEFSKESLNECTNAELLAKTMHWSNKVCKNLDDYIQKVYSFETNNEYQQRKKKRIYDEVFACATGLDGLRDFLMDYFECKDLSEDEIKKEYFDNDKESFDGYKQVRRQIKQKLVDLDERGDFSDKFEEVVKFITLRIARADAYNIKDLAIQRLMYEVEKEENKDIVHYVRKNHDYEGLDQNIQEDNMGTKNYVYGVAINGYSEPYEVHFETDKKMANSFDKQIVLVEGMMKKQLGIDSKVKIPITESEVLIKTGIPYKETKKQNEYLKKLSNTRFIKDSIYQGEDIPKSKLYLKSEDTLMSPIRAVITQSISNEYMSQGLENSKINYTHDGIEKIEDISI